MLTLYHGSIEIVAHPEIRLSNRLLDFGHGFYLTSSEHQAEDWVRRRLRENGMEQGYVNIYSLDLSAAASELQIQKFYEANDAWLDFVMHNRTRFDFTHTFDIVAGPVANDRVYTAFALYEGGIIDRATLIADLKTYKLVDQYLLHTERALKFLNFQTAKIIKL